MSENAAARSLCGHIFVYLLLVWAVCTALPVAKTVSSARSYATVWQVDQDPMEPPGSRRLTQGEVRRRCQDDYNCEEDVHEDELGIKTRFRCLHPGCGARVQRMRDCIAHHKRHVPPAAPTLTPVHTIASKEVRVGHDGYTHLGSTWWCVRGCSTSAVRSVLAVACFLRI